MAFFDRFTVKKPSDTVLIFSPHQDDELLTMGIAGINLRKAGYTTHVILCTDGAKSCVRDVLDDGQVDTCEKCDGPHNVALSEAEFTAARDREFTESCMRLGYAPDTVHIVEQDRPVDGCLSEKESTAIIEHYLHLYPDARVMTVSPFVGPEQHRDHRQLGAAAVKLFKQHRISDLMLYVEPYFTDAFRHNNKRMILEEETLDSRDQAALDRAIASYGTWQPAQGRYAVGLHSVTDEFKDFLHDKTAFHHKVGRHVSI